MEEPARGAGIDFSSVTSPAETNKTLNWPSKNLLNRAVILSLYSSTKTCLANRFLVLREILLPTTFAIFNVATNSRQKISLVTDAFNDSLTKLKMLMILF
jgi:hypothetical protein